MIGRRTRLVLSGVLGLLVALASSSALGALIFDPDALPVPAVGQGDAIQPLAEGCLDTGGMGAGLGATLPGGPLTPPDDEENPPTVDRLEALAPAGGSAGPPSSLSQGGGNGGSNSAIPGASSILPDPALQTALPTDARPILPTGPPFGLLRPPRACFAT